MSMNPLPKIRSNVSPKEYTWNEHFYTCLGKGIWFLAVLVLFAVIICIRLTLGTLGGLGNILLMLILSVAAVYLIVALPASIIYAFVMRNRYKKE